MRSLDGRISDRQAGRQAERQAVSGAARTLAEREQEKLLA